MECRDHSHAVHVEKLSAQPRNRRSGLKHRLRGKGAKTAHDFRADGRELLLQERIAGGDFVRLGIAVFRRTAFQDIADVDVFTLEIDRLDDLRQQLARAADERQALLVFVVARRFADEDELGVGIARAEDDVGALRSELAALAVADFGADGFEGDPSADQSQTGSFGSRQLVASRRPFLSEARCC